MGHRVGVYTSIAPAHVLGDEQQRCARSWMDAGYRYVTVNGEGDVFTLPDGAEAVKVRPSTEHRRPYVYLQSLIDTAIADEVDCAILTNSDIELRGDIASHIEEAMRGHMVIGRRMNHDSDGAKAEQWGVDVFITPRDVLKAIPRNLFVIGQTWWDYWLPWWAMHSGVKVRIAEPGMYWHKNHKIQHSPEEWDRMTALFQGTTGHMVKRSSHDTGMSVWKKIQTCTTLK